MHYIGAFKLFVTFVFYLVLCLNVVNNCTLNFDPLVVEGEEIKIFNFREIS